MENNWGTTMVSFSPFYACRVGELLVGLWCGYPKRVGRFEIWGRSEMGYGAPGTMVNRTSKNQVLAAICETKSFEIIGHTWKLHKMGVPPNHPSHE